MGLGQWKTESKLQLGWAEREGEGWSRVLESRAMVHNRNRVQLPVLLHL